MYTLSNPLIPSLTPNRCRDAIGCHRWSNEDLVGSLRLEKCDYACYPLDEKRRKEKFPPAQTESSPVSVIPLSTEAILLEDPAAPVDGPEVESSGELGVIPLETTTETVTVPPAIGREPRSSELYIHVRFDTLIIAYRNLCTISLAVPVYNTHYIEWL